MFKTSDVRRAYLDFFVSNGHTEVASSSLVPDNDPTLMFTNSGMVQFKDVFTGKKVLPFKRATTAQKSLRAGGKHNDLDNVGYTARHHTFFEMLGNFSFGDYFKEEAISWAWEFVNKILGLPADRLLVTVHTSDEAAALLWKKIAGFSDEKIIRIPTSDNFWTMGDTGPCGPCSEIFYDHGSKVQGGPPGSADVDGDRFVEIWNLVFTQFNAVEDGSKVPLDHPCIDTGMGLERVTAVMQGIHTNYEIDLFKGIISDVKNITSCDSPQFEHHYNVIADHMRAICFMIADGITPSNEGRGYVLRRIIRRAIRHGYTMGMKEPFLYRLVHSVKNSMGEHYKELIHFESPTAEVLKGEESSFMRTIDNGMSILKTEVERVGSSSIFPAEVAYKLYDTYGFPIDLTQDVLKTYKKTINESEFEKLLLEQREKSKKAWVGTGDSTTAKVWYQIKDKVEKTEFMRSSFSLDGDILAIIKDEELVDSVAASDSENSIYIISDKTPFYAESGGQVGDTGQIRQGANNIAEVIDTQIIAGVYAHKSIVRKGAIISHNSAKFEIDEKKRLGNSRNHTATHILQKVLRQVLGDHVSQKGSLVTNTHFRFDFIHNGSIDSEQIHLIERIVNDTIDKGFLIKTEIMPLDDAIASGAMALFGEKYPEEVRVVTIGNDWSKELCGGEHVYNTLQVKNIKILSVSSIGSGIKRIEAVTGDFVRLCLENEIDTLADKLQAHRETIRNLERQVLDISASKDIECREEQLANGITFVMAHLADVDHKVILSIIDKRKANKLPLIILVTNTNNKNNKAAICLYSNLDVNAVEVLKDIMNLIEDGIRVGGRTDLAQSGGITLKDTSEFESIAKSVVKKLKL